MGVLFGGRTGRERRLDTANEQQYNQHLTQLTALAQEAAGRGRGFLDQGGANLAPVLQFYNRLAGGNRGDIQQLLAPQIDSAAEADNQNLAALYQFGARGSRRADRIGSFNQGTQDSLIRTQLQARTAANDQLSNLSQLLFGLGQGLYNTGTGASGNALGNVLNNRGLNLQERGVRQQGLFQGLDFAGGLAGFGAGLYANRGGGGASGG